MRREEFAADQWKHLVAIQRGVAFLPPPLPPDIAITPLLLRASNDAQRAISELVGMSRMTDLAGLTEPFYVVEAMASTRIEGIHTEVLDVLVEAATPRAVTFHARDRALGEETFRNVQEVQNARAAAAWGAEHIAEGRAITESFIRELHASLMTGVRGEDKSPGQFRSVQAYIADRDAPIDEARYVPPPPEQIDPAMEELVGFIRSGGMFGPLIDGALLHYQFEAIHPFADGNGRLGRLLIGLYLVKCGLLDEPMLPVSLAFDRRRDAYLDRLLAVSTRAEWNAWLHFVLEALAEQATDAIARFRQLDELRRKYSEHLVPLRSKVPLSGMAMLFRNPVVSVPMVVDATGTTYPTARSAVDVLVEQGILEPYRRISGTMYWLAPEIIATVFDP